MTPEEKQRIEQSDMLSEKQIAEIFEAVYAGAGVSPETGIRLCYDWRALRKQISELKTIVDVGTSDNPATALSKLHKIQHDAATSMRSRCVEAVRALAADVEHGDALLSAKVVIATLKSVTLQEQEKQ